MYHCLQYLLFAMVRAGLFTYLFIMKYNSKWKPFYSKYFSEYLRLKNNPLICSLIYSILKVLCGQYQWCLIWALVLLWKPRNPTCSPHKRVSYSDFSKNIFAFLMFAYACGQTQVLHLCMSGLWIPNSIKQEGLTQVDTFLFSDLWCQSSNTIFHKA